jgi:RNA polymerase sigma-70 factor (family 1)
LESNDLQHNETAAGINQEQFEKMFHIHYEAIRNYIYYKSGDIKEAEDITQEVFLKVWEKRESIILKTVRPLLYTIAGNIFLNQHQHKQVVLKFAIQQGREEKALSPDFDIEMREFDERLQKALSELTEKSRTVFLMSRIDLLSYQDISFTLGISVKAVEKRMNKALKFLKERLDVKL